MEFAPVALADLPHIADLINGAYRGEDGRAGWTHEGHLVAGPRTSAAELAADLAADPRAVILAAREEPGGAIVGSVWLNPLEDYVWYLGLLAVRVQGQARGVGRALLEGAETFAARRGARRMRLTVIHVREELAAWYERRGYRRTGDSHDFPARFTTLRDGLRLAVLEKPLAG